MTNKTKILMMSVVAASLAWGITVAQSQIKQASCVWDNGSGAPESYPCEFITFNDDGSFSAIRADTYELMVTIESPGVGTMQEYADGRALLDFGRVYRSASDPACWVTEGDAERLCVY
jgi:hypothetical protein